MLRLYGYYDVAPTSYGGDSPAEVRCFARERYRWLFATPGWAVLLRSLRFVFVDDCHQLP
nr:hypothetical protein [Mycobacterium lepromatosis]